MPRDASDTPMCSDTPTAPYSWNNFFSCWDLLGFFSSALLLCCVWGTLPGSWTQSNGQKPQGKNKEMMTATNSSSSATWSCLVHQGMAAGHPHSSVHYSGYLGQ